MVEYLRIEEDIEFCLDESREVSYAKDVQSILECISKVRHKICLEK